MQVKKFEAPTISEALSLVKTELGPDAIILSTKKHRRGFGLLSKSSVEITAAVSDKALVRKKITEKVLPEEMRERVGKMSASRQSQVIDRFSDHYIDKSEKRKAAKSQSKGVSFRYIDIHDEESQQVAQAAAPTQQRAAPQQQQSQQQQSQQNAYGRNGRIASAEPGEMIVDKTNIKPTVPEAQKPSPNVEREIHQLKAMIEELKSDQMAMSDAKLTVDSTEEINEEFRNLLRNGIDKKFASSLMRNLVKELDPQQIRNRDKIIETLAVEMMSGVKIDDPFTMKPGDPQRVFAILGPTGVGKTTTIAKIASEAILNHNLRVGMINVDYYKVAAVDQLATYSRILNVPFRQVSTSMELDRALMEFKPLDLVLIDTSGRSQKDTQALAQLKQLLGEFPAIRSSLVLSATTRDLELYDVLQRFRIFNPTSVAFTKLDECSTFGAIYNVALKSGLPLARFAQGQRVPEDIETATKERVVGLILDV